MLTYKALTKKFKNFKAVDDLNMEIANGTILGFLGPNGAGKTTTIKMSCGLIKPTSGEIEYDGYSIMKYRKNYIRNIGAVLEGNRNIYWKLTPKENMEYFAGIRGISSKKSIKSRIDEFIELFGLKDKRNIECSKLSRGMQQKVAISCAMIHNPKVLFLDEPTLGLDVGSVVSMEKILKNIISKDRIVILTSHDLKFISTLCDRIVIINKGSKILDRNIGFLNYYTQNCIYRITTSILTDDVRNTIVQKFNIEFKESFDRVEIRVVLDCDNKIYELLKILKINHIDLIDINKERVELKDVFMDLINGDVNEIKEKI